MVSHGFRYKMVPCGSRSIPQHASHAAPRRPKVHQSLEASRGNCDLRSPLATGNVEGNRSTSETPFNNKTCIRRNKQSQTIKARDDRFFMMLNDVECEFQVACEKHFWIFLDSYNYHIKPSLTAIVNSHQPMPSSQRKPFFRRGSPPRKPCKAFVTFVVTRKALGRSSPGTARFRTLCKELAVKILPDFNIRFKRCVPTEKNGRCMALHVFLLKYIETKKNWMQLAMHNARQGNKDCRIIAGHCIDIEKSSQLHTEITT